jgi:Na+/H+ antiporter NhaD/arsenite permease-like protein
MPLVRRDSFMRWKKLAIALAMMALLGSAGLGLVALINSAHAQEATAPEAAMPAGAEHSAEAASHGADSHEGGHPDIGESLEVWTVIPFATLLLCIAILPLATPHWWEHNSSKAYVAFSLGLAMAAYLVIAFGSDGLHALSHSMQEYVSFIMLLGALYVISGGIFVRGSLDGTPAFNTLVLGIGAIIANFIGTTGASVLLVRPLLRANVPRQKKAHILIFFIFIVSNCGGLLTALGDPPLFLGYLAGVPFTWTFRMWDIWLIVNGALLVIFYIWDTIVFNREEIERPGSQLEEVQHHAPLGIMGMHNFLFLAAIVAIIYCSGAGIGNGGTRWPFGIAEGLMLATAVGAYFSTEHGHRANNKFTFAPILEVAILFVGIFATMIPALHLLNTHGSELGLAHAWHFFWATGALSSFLDNAPTYVTFAATASGMFGIPLEGQYLRKLVELPGESDLILEAISAGAVFMGANTYIGNGPNFMVKAIAEEAGVKMPSFFGYMVYSGLVLLPLFVIVTLYAFV